MWLLIVCFSVLMLVMYVLSNLLCVNMWFGDFVMCVSSWNFVSVSVIGILVLVVCMWVR